MTNTRYKPKTHNEPAVWIEKRKEDNREQLDRVHQQLLFVLSTELTPRQAELVQLRFEDGKTIRQIAREQGVAPSTVSRTLARAQRRLHSCLQFAL